MDAVTIHSVLEPKKIKSATVSTSSLSIYHKEFGIDAMILGFWILSFIPVFSLSFLTFIKRFFSSSSLAAGIIYISDIVTMSPDSLDSSLCFIQRVISLDALCIEVK